jgi:SNF2 family DNA or RNA helicase
MNPSRALSDPNKKDRDHGRTFAYDMGAGKTIMAVAVVAVYRLSDLAAAWF